MLDRGQQEQTYSRPDGGQRQYIWHCLPGVGISKCAEERIREEEVTPVRLEDKRTQIAQTVQLMMAKKMWVHFVTQMDNDKALHKIWNFRRKMNKIITINLSSAETFVEKYSSQSWQAEP